MQSAAAVELAVRRDAEAFAQLCELAFMRCDAQFGRIGFSEQRAIDQVERIGVEYCRPPPFEHCGEAFAGLLVASEAGPYQKGGDPFVVARPRKVALLDYQFGGGVGMGMLAQQLYIPCPAAHRGFGGQQRCARHGARNHGQ